jgi:hypothetical protein
MTKSLIRLGHTLLLSGIIVAATEPMSRAGTNVLVMFSGKSATGVLFSGYFEYDQSKPKASNYSFNFNGSPLTHKICYSAGGATGTGSGPLSEPFTIVTSNTDSFQLKSTCQATGTSVVITFSRLNVTCTPTALPLCSSGTTPTFPSAGTFQLTGTTTFSGTITWTSCTEAASVIACPCPPPTAVVIGHPVGGGPVYAPVQAPVYAYSAPAPAPMVVCQPRPACCLSRLFSRGYLRIGCR